MTDKLKKTIEEELTKLPIESQEVINSFDWVKISEEIGAKYSLDGDGINDLLTEIFLVLSGVVEEDSLSLNIENHVNRTRDEAMKMTEEIYEKILNPMLEKLELSVRNSFKYKNAGWKQTVNFIISGGNYSVFLEKDEEPNVATNTPSVNIKNNFTI